MNRLGFTAAAAVTLAVLASGCGQKFNSPFQKKPAATSSGKADYFEMKKDGTTYVFSRVESMNTFRDSGAAPRGAETQQLGGKTVVFENRSYNDYNRLVAEYKKAHNVQ
jgi:hypothetical protein